VDASLLLILFAVLLYVAVLLPRRRQMARQRALLSEIAPGDTVVTIGGLRGEVVAVEGEDVVIAAAPGVELRFVRDAIGRRLPAPDDGSSPDDEVDTEGAP
jgi:preprotein translocase subunit YajC